MKIAGWAAHLASAAAFQLLILPADSASAGPVPALLGAPSGGSLAMYVSGTARSVMAKLKRPECLAVLSDFRDGQDHLLKENLEDLRMTAPEFFASLTFVDGSHGDFCGRNVLAVTSPGNHVIAICTPAFTRFRFENPRLAASVLIHEMLHALGLGENPPSSLDITRQVRRRCEAWR
jgi:hypothetical protein